MGGADHKGERVPQPPPPPGALVASGSRLPAPPQGGSSRQTAADETAANNVAISDTIIITSDPSALATATHIVLPGVGAFGDCIAGLNAVPGLRAALEKKVLEEKTPFLGICVGMQMLMEKGFEHGEHAGLGWIAGSA